MNKTIVFIIVFTYFINFCSGQINFQDSSEVYNYWVERGIIEMVYVYMEDEDNKRGTLPVVERKGKENYKETFVVNCFSVKNVNQNFPKIKEFLENNNWGNTSKWVLEPLHVKYKNREKLDSSFFNIPARNGGYYSSDFWTQKSTEIVNKYNEHLLNIEEINQENNILLEKETVAVHEKENFQIKELFNRLNWKFILGGALIFIVGFFIGGAILYFISKKNIYSFLKEEKNEYLHSLKLKKIKFPVKYIGLIYILKLRKDKYKGELIKVNSELKNLNEVIDNLKNENTKLKQNETIKKNSNKIEKAETREWDIYKEEKKTNKLFFSMPESEGHFIISNGEPSNDGRKYFRIEYLEKSDQGQLFYISSDRDKRAINRLESYLKPVCDIENIMNAEKATRVDFISSGKVVLIDDSWVIDSKNKVKIKLV